MNFLKKKFLNIFHFALLCSGLILLEKYFEHEFWPSETFIFQMLSTENVFYAK